MDAHSALEVEPSCLSVVAVVVCLELVVVSRAFSSASSWVNSLLTGGSFPSIIVTASCTSSLGVDYLVVKSNWREEVFRVVVEILPSRYFSG